MAVPTFLVEEVAFRFDATSQAIALGRRDGTPVQPPEWTREGRSEPAAYAKIAGTTIGIRAVFSCADPLIASATVRARRIETEGSIGDIGEVTVSFTRGVSATVPCHIAWAGFHGVDVELVRWQWQFEVAGAWVDANQTEHEIAIVLSRPKAPWKATLPWWEAMCVACDAAKGTTTIEAASTAITKTVLGKWGGRFLKWDPGLHFTSDVGAIPPRFDCSSFLDVLHTAATAPVGVDCSDVASIVSTLAGILGCPLSQLAISTSTTPTNIVNLVGHPDWSEQEFALHEIAVRGKVGSGARIWDPCLQLSGDRIVGSKNPPGKALLPANLPPGQYLRRLLSVRGVKLHEIINEPALTREVGPLPTEVEPPVIDDRLRLVAAMYGLDLSSAPEQPSEVRLFDPPVIDGWELVEPPRGQDDRKEAGRERVARTRWRSASGSGRLITVDVYVCASALAARRRLVAVLGRFNGALERKPVAARREGEVLFVTPSGSAMVASYLNTVIVVSRATVDDALAPAVRAFFDGMASVLDKAAQPI